MDIKIGEKSLATRQPGNLDAGLIASTGCNKAETAQQLAGTPSAGRIASALHPFLGEDAPSVPELAQMIADADDIDILIAVRGLYVDAPTTVVAPTPPSKGKTTA